MLKKIKNSEAAVTKCILYKYSLKVKMETLKKESIPSP